MKWCVCEHNAQNTYINYGSLLRNCRAKISSTQPVEANTVRGRRRLRQRANDRM
jgi:hypothetical protein